MLGSTYILWIFCKLRGLLTVLSWEKEISCKGFILLSAFLEQSLSCVELKVERD
jgi:hypothetical protein